MQVLQFIRSLAQSFQRNDITENLRLLREDLVNQTLPLYETALADLGGKQLRSKVGQDFIKKFNQSVDTPFRGDWLAVTVATMKVLQNNLDTLENLVEKNFARDVVIAGMTYQKAQILQYISYAEFFSQYARQVLLYITAAEANVQAKTLQPGKERPVPEIEWLQNNQDSFFRIFRIVVIKSTDLTKLLESIPEITITEESGPLVAQTQGPSKIDPLQFGLISLNWNPFYKVGVKWANYKIDKNNRAKAEKRAIEFRLEQLRKQASGQPDPQLELVISNYEEQVNKLAAKIAKFEEV